MTARGRASRGAAATGSRAGEAARGGLARLWSPWRMTYIKRADEPAGCLFCRVARSRDSRAHLVVHRGAHAFVMLNRYPYNPGHLMVAVPRHAGSFAELEPAEGEALLAAVAQAERALAAEYRPHAMNVGANLGRVAGAGFPGHLHVHLVPRWTGDTNFMPVVGETRVLPESLGKTWARLRRAMAAVAGRGAPRRGNGARRAASGSRAAPRRAATPGPRRARRATRKAAGGGRG